MRSRDLLPFRMPSMPDAPTSLQPLKPDSLMEGYIVAAGLGLAFRVFCDGIAVHTMMTVSTANKDLGHTCVNPSLQNLAKA